MPFFFRSAETAQLDSLLRPGSSFENTMPGQAEKVRSALVAVCGTSDLIGHERTLITAACLMTSGILAIAVASSSIFPLLVLLIVPSVLRFILRSKLRLRSAAIERDLPAFLLSLASSLRTGLEPLEALQKTSALFSRSGPLGQSLQQVCSDLDQGIDETEVLKGLILRTGSRDITTFSETFLLARKEGSSLAECLKRLARVSRQRQSFRRKTRAALAMQKLSAIGIGICLFIIALIQLSTNPTSLQDAFAHPIGSKLLVLSFVLFGAGMVWLFRMTQVDFE